MIDEPLVRPDPKFARVVYSPGPPTPGAKTTEAKGAAAAFAALVAVLVNDESESLRQQAIGYVFWLAVAYIVARTAVKVAHELATRKRTTT